MGAPDFWSMYFLWIEWGKNLSLLCDRLPEGQTLEFFGQKRPRPNGVFIFAKKNGWQEFSETTLAALQMQVAGEEQMCMISIFTGEKFEGIHSFGGNTLPTPQKKGGICAMLIID